MNKQSKYKGRGSWFLNHIASKYGRRAAERKREEFLPNRMPPLDRDYKFTGPEFQFDDIPSQS